MTNKRPTEQELLNDLDTYAAHGDELTEPLPDECESLRKLKSSVKRFERPTDPASNTEGWDEWFDAEGVSGDFMEGP